MSRKRIGHKVKPVIGLFQLAEKMMESEIDADAKEYLQKVKSQIHHEAIPNEKVYGIFSMMAKDKNAYN